MEGKNGKSAESSVKEDKTQNWCTNGGDKHHWVQWHQFVKHCRKYRCERESCGFFKKCWTKCEDIDCKGCHVIGHKRWWGEERIRVCKKKKMNFRWQQSPQQSSLLTLSKWKEKNNLKFKITKLEAINNLAYIKITSASGDLGLRGIVYMIRSVNLTHMSALKDLVPASEEDQGARQAWPGHKHSQTPTFHSRCQMPLPHLSTSQWV